MQEGRYSSRSSDDCSARQSSDEWSSHSSSAEDPPLLPKPKGFGPVKPLQRGRNPGDDALYRLWEHLSI
jgi:hypothetical protein